MKSEIVIISVDFQIDFSEPTTGQSVDFLQNTLLDFILDHQLRVYEILSDYRLPRLGHKGNLCDPNTQGYDSIIPETHKSGLPWIKCMHSPLWTRDNIGKKDSIPGIPYQDPEAFKQWLIQNIGEPREELIVVLIGLTMECCILGVAQELYHLGYQSRVLYEATDPMNERMDFKEFIAKNSSLRMYAESIHFDEFVTLVKEST